MTYSTHKIKKSGHIELREIKDGVYHRSVIAPNQELTKYNEVIEADSDFEKYRTQENAEAYEAQLEAEKPTKEEIKEQKKQQAEQKAREKVLDQLIKKEMDESGITEELEKEKDKIDKE